MTGLCQYWGDPHVLAFARRPGENRPLWRCTEQGTYTLLKNELIDAKVTTKTGVSRSNFIEKVKPTVRFLASN